MNDATSTDDSPTSGYQLSEIASKSSRTDQLKLAVQHNVMRNHLYRGNQVELPSEYTDSAVFDGTVGKKQP